MHRQDGYRERGWRLRHQFLLRHITAKVVVPMNPTPKKPKRAGRVMWCQEYGDGPKIYATESDAKRKRRDAIYLAEGGTWCPTPTPVLVLPLSDVQALRSAADEATAKIMRRQDGPFFSGEFTDAVLLAIGVPAKLLKK